MMKEEKITTQDLPMSEKANDIFKIVSLLTGKEKVDDKTDMNAAINETYDLLQSLAKKKAEKGNKKYKLKAFTSSKLKMLSKENSILACIKRTNRKAEIVVTKVVDNKVFFDGAWRACNPDFVFMLDGKYPILFFNEWSLLPETTKQAEDKYTDMDYRMVEAEKTILSAIHTDGSEIKKGFGGMLWVFIVLGVAVLAYIIFANKK